MAPSRRHPALVHVAGYIYIAGGKVLDGAGDFYRVKAGCATTVPNLEGRVKEAFRAVYPKGEPLAKHNIATFAFSLRVPDANRLELLMHEELEAVVSRPYRHGAGRTEIFEDLDSNVPQLTAEFCFHLLERLSMSAWALTWEAPAQVVIERIRPFRWRPSTELHFPQPSDRIKTWLSLQLPAAPPEPAATAAAVDTTEPHAAMAPAGAATTTAAAASEKDSSVRYMWRIDGDWLEKMVSPSDATSNSIIFGEGHFKRLCGGTLPSPGDNICLYDVDARKPFCVKVAMHAKNWTVQEQALMQWKKMLRLALGDKICVRRGSGKHALVAANIHVNLDIKCIKKAAASTAAAAIEPPAADGAADAATIAPAVGAVAAAAASAAAAGKRAQKGWQLKDGSWWAVTAAEATIKERCQYVSLKAVKDLFGTDQEPQTFCLWNGKDTYNADLKCYAAGKEYKIRGSGFKDWVIKSGLVLGDEVHLKRADPTAMPDGSKRITLHIKRVLLAQEAGEDGGDKRCAASGSTGCEPDLSAAAKIDQRDADSTAGGSLLKKPRLG